MPPIVMPPSSTSSNSTSVQKTTMLPNSTSNSGDMTSSAPPQISSNDQPPRLDERHHNLEGSSWRGGSPPIFDPADSPLGVEERSASADTSLNSAANLAALRRERRCDKCEFCGKVSALDCVFYLLIFRIKIH